MTKAELRKLYLSKRTRLPEEEYRRACESICSTFFRNVDLGNVRVVHSFLPIVKNKEPDTWLIVRRLESYHQDIRISIPRTGSNGQMTSYYYEGPDQIVESGWGIPEPAVGVVTEPADIDMVLVPLLAFDRRGHRVGYGRGFYDRFLAACREDTIRAGLSVFAPEDKIDDVAHFDMPLSLVVTPDTVYRF